MKKLLLIILLLVSNLSYGQYKGDKIMHFKGGAAVAGITSFTVMALNKNKPLEVAAKRAFWYSLAASVVAGVTKEVIDKKNGASFDFKDLGATAGGGLTVSFSLDKLYKSKRKTIF